MESGDHMTVHNQRELSAALRSGSRDITLAGGRYRIPLSITGVSYTGADGAVVGFSGKGEIYLADYAITVTGCIFDDDAKARMTDSVPDNIAIDEQKRREQIEREKMPAPTPQERYECDIKEYCGLAKKSFASGDHSAGNYYLAELCFRAKSMRDFKTEYEAAGKMQPADEYDRAKKKLFRAEALCYMGRESEGVKLFEELIHGKAEAEEAAICLSRFYRRKGNFIKEKFWYAYGFKKFGAYGEWEYYNDYDEQFDVKYYYDDE